MSAGVFFKISIESQQSVFETERVSVSETVFGLSRLDRNTSTAAVVYGGENYLLPNIGHLTICDAVQETNFNEAYLAKLCGLGGIEAVVVGGEWFISRYSLAQHLLQTGLRVAAKVVDTEHLPSKESHPTMHLPLPKGDQNRDRMSKDKEIQPNIEKPKTKESKTGKTWLSEVWWVPIVVALIGLIGVLIPTYVEHAKKTPTPQLDSDFDYALRVQDRETGEPIPNVQVTIEVIGQAPLDEITDSNGFARIFVDTSRAGQPARLIVQVAGYMRYTQNIDLKQDRLPDIVQLEPEPLNTPKTTTVSSAPTSEPTPVPEPTPTATAQPAPIFNCSAPAEPFAEVWVTTQDTIGCALGSLVTGLIAEESFQRGKMFWRESFDYSQAIVMFSDGTWQIFKHQPYDDTQESEFSCLDENTPAQCPPTPKRGLGMMWCDIPTIRDRLGNAIECERGYQGLMQQFEQGFMIQSDNGSIYVFYGHEKWAVGTQIIKKKTRAG